MKMTNGSNSQTATEQADKDTRTSPLGGPTMPSKRRNAFSDGTDLSYHTPIPTESKPIEVQQRLEVALRQNIMFNHLQQDERNAVFAAMFEVPFKSGERIIEQGAEGDNFYVVDAGTCDIYVSKNGGEPVRVMDVSEGGSFGELALISGQKRAATVIARTDVRLWAIGRPAYRRILMEATVKKRTLYQEFLEKVSILHHLDKYERVSLADALEECSFESNQVIVRQGDSGDKFYIIVEGEVRVTQRDANGTEAELAILRSSDYFGEIALLTDRPRAATVTAITKTKCVEMDRQRFNRLLGPCEDILRRNMEMYNQYMSASKAASDHQ
eukprot:gene14589-17250_t